MNTEVIAEIGWNFMGNMELAQRMIADAASAGATCVKFQYWNPSKLAPGPWDSDGRREIYQSAALSPEKLETLMHMALGSGVEFLCSAFNCEDAQVLRSIGAESIKIPSHEAHNIALHQYASANFNRVYVSLGAASRGEVLDAADVYNESVCNWTAMHCVSSYPLDVDRANLRRLKWFKGFASSIGYSDHTESLVVPAVSVSLGCSVIEKHFTSSKDLPGRDNKFALTAPEFRQMVEYIKEAEACMIERGLAFQSVEVDTVNNYRGRWG